MLRMSIALGAQNVTPSGFTPIKPSGLGFDAAGDLFVLDSGNAHLIEVPQPAGSAPYMVPVAGLAVPGSPAVASGQIRIKMPLLRRQRLVADKSLAFLDRRENRSAIRPGNRSDHAVQRSIQGSIWHSCPNLLPKVCQ